MSYQDLIDESPGLALHKLLKRIFPFDVDLSNTKSIFQSLDSVVKADGELYETIYESTINYLVRRVITLASFLYRKNEDDEVVFLRELRRALDNNYSFPEHEFEKIITLLYDCAKISGKRHPSGSTTKAYNRLLNPRCYICGKLVQKPSETKADDSATLDHLFPNTLGGNSVQRNLKISCKSCNEAKGDIISASDFHYENICLVSDQNDENFSVEMNKHRRIAIFAKSDFRCAVCDTPASEVGELELTRKNNRDNWHYLNVYARCERHN